MVQRGFVTHSKDLVPGSRWWVEETREPDTILFPLHPMRSDVRVTGGFRSSRGQKSGV